MVVLKVQVLRRCSGGVGAECAIRMGEAPKVDHNFSFGLKRGVMG